MKVVFVYCGVAKYKGRLLKQIRTLKNAGIECILFHGSSVPETALFEATSVRSIHHNMSPMRSRVLNTIKILHFNLISGLRTASLRPDAVICEGLFSVFAGVVAKLLCRSCSLVFDSNELFMEKGMRYSKKLFWSLIHSLAFRTADVVLHAEPNRLLFCKRKYKSTARHFLLENLSDPPSSFNVLNNARKLSIPLRVLYLGKLMPSRLCSEIISSFSKISSDFAQCDLVGFGETSYVEALSRYAYDMDITNVRILPPVEHDEIFDVMMRYDIGLAFYENTCLNQYYCAPNKLYDYLLSGLYVITNDYPGLVDLIQNNGAGICIRHVDAESMLDALRAILQLDHIKGDTYQDIQRYSWEYQETDYVALIESLRHT